MPSLKNTISRNAALLKLLYYKQSITVSEAGALLGRSVPHISKQLSELFDAGYIQEGGIAASSGGRRPATFVPVSNALYFISVAIDRYKTEIGIYDSSIQLVQETALISEPPTKGDISLLNKICARIEDEISKSKINRKKIFGVAVSMPGFIDIGKGVNYTFFPENVNLKEYIEKELKLPVYVDNDSSVIALGEVKFGALLEKDVMVVNITWGIGLGMVVNGEIFRGHSGFAGEFSHIPMYKEGILCSCGKRDCLETQASLAYIESVAQKELFEEGIVTSIPKKEAVTIDHLFHHAKQGDRYCIQLISKAAYNIGRGLAILIHILNPELIVLSGRGADLGKLWLAPVQQAINEHSILRLAENTKLTVSKSGSAAALKGGVALLLESITTTI